MKLFRIGTTGILLASGAFAQHPVGTLLTIVTEHITAYRRDVTDYALLATQPGPINLAIDPRSFGETLLLGDIVSVNGRRVKGTQTIMVTNLVMGPNAAPGQVIADVIRTAWAQRNFDILDEDGRPIGSIRTSGMVGGPPPPGATRQILGASFVVVGGTGAFLGARGYSGGIGADLVPQRRTSMSEDPANRRLLGGGTEVHKIYILPMVQPDIVTGANGPAVFHADFKPVTAQNPARPGELVILRMTGLGPTIPGVEPGQAFPLDALQPVNSPVEATVNGEDAEVLNRIGWPGTVGEYRVDLRIPAAAATGPARLQISAAWILGTEFQIPLR